MKKIADLLFEAKILKELPRSGYHFLGAGRESVAEHCFSTAFIAYVMSKLEPGVNALKLISMCLVHDLAEARTGDLNYVQKNYVRSDEMRALADAVEGLGFGSDLMELVREFNAGRTPESQLAHDADQLALVLELKDLMDIGYHPPHSWIEHVLQRLKTETGRQIAHSVMQTHRDAWWLKNTVDSTNQKN